MPTWWIRSASEDDAVAMARLCDDLGYPSRPDEVTARLRRIAPDDDHAVLVAEVEGEVVGWIHVYGSPLLVREAWAELGGLVVSEGHRGGGIGRALLEAAEHWAGERGYGGVRLRSNVRRTGSHGFYEALGYALAKTSHTFEKPSEAQAEGTRST